MSTVKETSHPEMGFAEQEVYIYIYILLFMFYNKKSYFYVLNYLTDKTFTHVVCRDK